MASLAVQSRKGLLPIPPIPADLPAAELTEVVINEQLDCKSLSRSEFSIDP